MIIVLLHLSYLGTGLLILRMARWSDDLPYIYRLLISYLLGLLIHVIILYAAFSVYLTTHVIPILLFCIGLAFLFIEIYLKLRPTRRQCLVKPKPTLSWITNGLIFITIIPPLLLITLVLTKVPEITYDAVAIWGIKAANFYHGNHIWSGIFTDIQRVHPHKGYPFFLPLMMYEHYALVGIVDDIFFKQGLWIFYLIGLIHFYIFLRDFIGSACGLVATGVILYMPMMSYSPIQGAITNGYADFPLALMILCSVGYCVHYFIHRKQAYLVGSMVAITSCLLLKVEGLAWFVVFFICFALTMFAKRNTPSRSEIKIFMFPFLILIPRLVIHSFLPRSSDITVPNVNEIILIKDSLPKVLCIWIRSLFDGKVWGILPLFIIIFYIIGLVRNLENKRNILAWSALMQLFVVFIVMTLFDVQLHRLDYYASHTYERLIIHIMPLTVYLAIVMNSPKYLWGSQESADD